MGSVLLLLFVCVMGSCVALEGDAPGDPQGRPTHVALFLTGALRTFLLPTVRRNFQRRVLEPLKKDAHVDLFVQASRDSHCWSNPYNSKYRQMCDHLQTATTDLDAEEVRARLQREFAEIRHGAVEAWPGLRRFDIDFVMSCRHPVAANNTCCLRMQRSGRRMPATSTEKSKSWPIRVQRPAWGGLFFWLTHYANYLTALDAEGAYGYRYDWLIGLRPDLIWYEDFPRLPALHPDRVYLGAKEAGEPPADHLYVVPFGGAEARRRAAFYFENVKHMAARCRAKDKPGWPPEYMVDHDTYPHQVWPFGFCKYQSDGVSKCRSARSSQWHDAALMNKVRLRGGDWGAGVAMVPGACRVPRWRPGLVPWGSRGTVRARPAEANGKRREFAAGSRMRDVLTRDHEVDSPSGRSGRVISLRAKDVGLFRCCAHRAATPSDPRSPQYKA